MPHRYWQRGDEEGARQYTVELRGGPLSYLHELLMEVCGLASSAAANPALKLGDHAWSTRRAGANS